LGSIRDTIADVLFPGTSAAGHAASPRCSAWNLAHRSAADVGQPGDVAGADGRLGWRDRHVSLPA
jgi:hypothetical protein